MFIFFTFISASCGCVSWLPHSLRVCRKRSGGAPCWPCVAPCGLLLPPGRTMPARVGERPCGAGNAAVPPNKKKEVPPITSKSHEDEFIRTERFQISCGRMIRVVSVFPKQGTETPADKLKALAELEFQQGKMCA